MQQNLLLSHEKEDAKQQFSTVHMQLSTRMRFIMINIFTRIFGTFLVVTATLQKIYFFFSCFIPSETQTMKIQSTFDVAQSIVCYLGDVGIVHFILLMKTIEQREGQVIPFQSQQIRNKVKNSSRMSWLSKLSTRPPFLLERLSETCIATITAFKAVEEWPSKHAYEHQALCIPSDQICTGKRLTYQCMNQRFLFHLRLKKEQRG